MLYNVYFSAKGTTASCAEYIGERLRTESRTYNWLEASCGEPPAMSGDDVLLFSMPVYGGYIPQLCLRRAQKLKGADTPAVIAAVYGNRHYDNALLQMKDMLTAQGFRVIAAGAFLAEHSVFPAVAAGRPDERDRAAMAAFAETCAALLQEDVHKYGEIVLPGAAEYDGLSFKGLPFHPDGDETCVGCGTCAAVCPQAAIDREAPRKTDGQRCISCGACIKACPVGARDYHDAVYENVRADFEKRNAPYRAPETFYAVRR